jgi:hypothetical protein
MDRENESNELRERKDDATDDTTLSEIEDEQKVPSDKSNSPTPERDEGSGRESNRDQDQPM